MNSQRQFFILLLGIPVLMAYLLVFSFIATVISPDIAVMTQMGIDYVAAVLVAAWLVERCSVDDS